VPARRYELNSYGPNSSETARLRELPIGIRSLARSMKSFCSIIRARPMVSGALNRCTTPSQLALLPALASNADDGFQAICARKPDAPLKQRWTALYCLPTEKLSELTKLNGRSWPF